jgi:hypothetical protein
MPFRRWYAEHGAKHPTAYSMLTLAVGMLACMAIAVLISVQASDRAIERDRQSRQEARKASCLLINQINNAYKEDPPVSTAGKNVAEAWTRVARAFGCDKE